MLKSDFIKEIDREIRRLNKYMDECVNHASNGDIQHAVYEVAIQIAKLRKQLVTK